MWSPEPSPASVCFGSRHLRLCSSKLLLEPLQQHIPDQCDLKCALWLLTAPGGGHSDLRSHNGIWRVLFICLKKIDFQKGASDFAIILFCFCITPSFALGIFLTLCAGITPGGLRNGPIPTEVCCPHFSYSEDFWGNGWKLPPHGIPLRSVKSECHKTNDHDKDHGHHSG